MALWQYTFYVVPKVSLERFEFPLLSLLEDGLFDDSSFWKPFELEEDFVLKLRDILSSQPSWSENVLIFGREDPTTVEIFIENNKVNSISLRVDFRNTDYEIVLSDLIELFVLTGLVVIDQDLNVLLPNMTIVKNKIEVSLQFEKYKILLGGSVR